MKEFGVHQTNKFLTVSKTIQNMLLSSLGLITTLQNVFIPKNLLPQHCFILEYMSRLKERFNFIEILTIYQIGSLFSSITFRLFTESVNKTPSGMLSKTTCFMKTLPLVTISLGIPNSRARRV